MAVSRKNKSLYNKIFDGTETKVANAIVSHQERKALRKYVRHMPKLTSKQKKEVKQFWRPYRKISTNWARYYTYITGKFDPRYIPSDLELTKIDQHFNSKKLGYGFNDKNYYSLLFKDIKQPKTIVRKIGGLLFDENYTLIDIDKAEELLKERQEVIFKPAQNSGSGRDISFYDTKNEIDKLLEVIKNKNEDNFVIQEIVKQHHELAKMHPASLNTVRIYTIMLEDGVHVLSASLKMGSGKNRIDNVSANSGIIVGVKENGQLMDKAYLDLYSGKTVDRHPDGMLLSEIKVPEFERMIETVKRAAQIIGNFRLVGWDMSVDENNEIVLIEANMRKAAIGPIQCEHGPFFGDLTTKVLDEVFGRKK